MLLAEYIAWVGFAAIHNGLKQFTTVHIGSHSTNKECLIFSLTGDVNRCEPLKSNVLQMWPVKKTEFT